MDSNTYKIVLIDDNKLFREFLASTLTDFGYSVVMAENGLEGLHQLKEHPDTDLVVVDLIMPIMDGYSFINAARDKYPDVPIVVISGVGSLKDALGAIRLGARDFINKPIESDELLKIVIERNIERCIVERSNREYRDFLETLAKTRSTQLDEAMAREVSIEKELHHQVCLYKSIFNSISSPMLLVEVGGELVLDANAAFAHLSGCQTHEAIGRSCSEIGIALTGPLPLASSPSAAKPAPVTTLQATLGGRRFTVQCQSIACHKDEQRGYATLLFSDSMK